MSTRVCEASGVSVAEEGRFVERFASPRGSAVVEVDVVLTETLLGADGYFKARVIMVEIKITMPA